MLYLACLAWVGARFGQTADLIAGAAGLVLGGLLSGRRWARGLMLIVSLLIVWAGIDLLYLTPAQEMPDRTIFELFWPAASFWLGFHAARRLRDFWTRKPRP